MSDNETTTDTNTVADVTKSVALEVTKELATTAAGCVVALVLTSGASVAVNKVRAIRAARKSSKSTDSVATPIV